VDIVECVSEPERTSFEQSCKLEYVRSNLDEEELLAIWNKNTKKEKEEINTKAYNETYAIFCTNHELTKITQSGIKAPGFQEDTEDKY
jgi:CO dehydrogenase nickel-insertion accessory protein CooC1